MFKHNLRRGAIIFLVVWVLLLGIGAGIALDRQAVDVHAQTATPNGIDLQLITEAWNKIDQYYVDASAKQSKPLTYGAISGMVNALGDTGHSTFLSPEMVKSERSFQQGQFEGIGAQVESKDGHVVIVAPFDDSPAQKAGLHAGQIILKVNGEDVDGQPVEQVVGKILGPAGTSVTLTVLDPKTNQTTDVTIVRARIVLQNVTWQRLPGTNTAHLRITAFNQGVSNDLRQALIDIQQQGITSIILDLRNNPGGLLNEAVNATSQFLASGDVLLQKDAQGKVTHIAVRRGGVATTIPMVVLVNKGSASAAEIMAGALQDAHRAILVGDTTFGTGTVLNEFALSDGSALMLATGEWLTPNGRVIWHKGIVPDQQVILPADVNILTPAIERTMTAEQLQASADQQLLKALSLLNKSAHNDATHSAAQAASVNQGMTSIDAWAVSLEWLARSAYV
jgi:carboxyl-terminal processing protease